jgi:two-component system, NarL family, response regulator LiaR
MSETFINPNDLIRVMVVDDHEMVRVGLRDFLRVYKDFSLVGEASDGEEAVNKCARVQPDVILMDLVMPRMNGVEAIRQISLRYPAVKIVALSSYDDEQLVPAALDAGAVSFIQKNVTMAQLAEVIRKAKAGLSTLSPLATQYLVSMALRPSSQDYHLTPREMEVLNLIVAGKSNAEIGKHLVISLPTVKAHVSQILTKLGTKTRAETIVFAIDHKIGSR